MSVHNKSHQVLIDALQAMVRHYTNPDLSHEAYRVKACQHAEHALAQFNDTKPAVGEPVYQVRGNSGSQWGDDDCWIEVSKESFEDAVSEGKEVRLLYIASHEDEEVRRRLQNLIAVARRINKESFAKGTQKVEHGLFVSLDFAFGAYDAEMRARASRQEVNQ